MMDEVLREVMIEIGKAIDSNKNQKPKVEQTGNQKAIDISTGQEQGLKYALEIVSKIKNKHSNNLRTK